MGKRGARIRIHVPGRAKESGLTALDVLERSDPDPFLAGIRHTQFAPVSRLLDEVQRICRKGP
jgi:hypothetical protein